MGLWIARMRRPGRGGPCPPQLPERADERQAAKRGSGLLQRRFRGGKPTRLASRLACGPSSRSSPRPWGRGRRPCRQRQKQRRCESSGLRAPFLCPETESGVEGGSTCRVLGVPPAPPGLSRTCSDTGTVTCVFYVLFLQAISGYPGIKKDILVLWEWVFLPPLFFGVG